MLNSQTKNRDDFPLPLAVLLLIAVLVALYCVNYEGPIQLQWARLEAAIEAHWPAATCFLTSLVLNLSWLALVLNRVIGLKKQGSRLSRLAKKENENPKSWVENWRPKIISGGLVVIVSWCSSIKYLGDFSSWLSHALNLPLSGVVHGNLAITSLIVLSIAIRGLSLLLVKRDEPHELPTFPKDKNCIVIGSVGEEA